MVKFDDGSAHLPDPNKSTLNPPWSCHDFASLSEAANDWFRFGFKPIPILPGSTEPAVNLDEWFASLSATTIAAHWEQHPDHEIAFQPGDDIVVLSVARGAGSNLLYENERGLDTIPNMVVLAGEIAQHYFRGVKGRCCLPKAKLSHDGHGLISLVSGQTLVMLPPSAGVSLTLFETNHVRDLTQVCQDLLDAANNHNARLMPLLTTVDPAEVNASADSMVVSEVPEPTPEPSVLVEPTKPYPVADPNIRRNALDKFNLSGMADQIERQLVEAIPFLGLLALLGQYTILFAPPNTGKTLILFALLIDAIIRGLVDPSLVYYIDLDDSSEGLASKLRIAQEYGFQVQAEGYMGFSVELFLASLQDMSEKDQAKGVVVACDTIKKFVDVMDKKKSSRFNRIMRQFVLKGGTVIGLAHTNKNLGANGKPVHGGTSDMRDDPDCVWVISTLPAQTGVAEKVIVCENLKRRGNVPDTYAIKYSTEPGISYHALLSSVQVVDDVELKPLKQAAAIQSDGELIATVAACIQGGINMKMRLRDAVVQRGGVSKRVALQIIEKYSGTDPSLHRWTYTVQERGAKVFVMLAQCDVPSTASQHPGDVGGSSVVDTAQDDEY